MDKMLCDIIWQYLLAMTFHLTWVAIYNIRSAVHCITTLKWKTYFALKSKINCIVGILIQNRILKFEMNKEIPLKLIHSPFYIVVGSFWSHQIKMSIKYFETLLKYVRILWFYDRGCTKLIRKTVWNSQ